jgi:transposase-like protein
MNKHPNHQPRRRSAAEWRRIIERWERSGQSARTFAERHDLSKSSLQWWRWRFRSEGSPAAESASLAELSFVPLTTSSTPGAEPPLAEARWVIETAAGVRVEMSGATALVVEGLGVALERVRERA